MTGTASASRPSPGRLSIAHLILLLPWVALVIDAWSRIGDNSFLWHVRAGTLQMDSLRVLTSDPFSFTVEGEPWRTQSWLVELLYGWGESSTGGLDFVPLMLLAGTTITFVGIGLVAHRYSQSVPATAVVLLMSTLVMISFLVPRPVLFSFALFPLVMLAWDKQELRWALPFLFWVWASSHGSFVIGLAYVGLSLIADRRWRLMPVAVVSGLATLVTAHGLGVVQMLMDFLEARTTLELLVEWQRPSILSPVFTPFLLGLVLIGLGLVRGRIPWRYTWVILPFAVLGFGALRSVPPAWLGLTPFMAMGMSGLSIGSARRFSLPAVVIFATVVAILPFVIRDDGSLDDERLPVEAAGHLDDTRAFHDDRAGGYLIWAEWPERQVFIDDRAELYGERMAEFVAVRDGEAPWRPVFERYGIEQALLRSGNEVLISELSEAGWATVHSDDSYVVMRSG